MTLTHVSGVSGLSETLEPPIEEPNSELIEQIESLKKDLEGAQAEIERYNAIVQSVLINMTSYCSSPRFIIVFLYIPLPRHLGIF